MNISAAEDMISVLCYIFLSRACRAVFLKSLGYCCVVTVINVVFVQLFTYTTDVSSLKTLIICNSYLYVPFHNIREISSLVFPWASCLPVPSSASLPPSDVLRLV